MVRSKQSSLWFQRCMFFTLVFNISRPMLIHVNMYIKFWLKCTTHLHKTSYTGSRHTDCFDRSIWSFPPKLKVCNNNFILYLLWLNNAIILHIAEFVKRKKLYTKIIFKIYNIYIYIYIHIFLKTLFYLHSISLLYYSDKMLNIRNLSMKIFILIC